MFLKTRQAWVAGVRSSRGFLHQKPSTIPIVIPCPRSTRSRSLSRGGLNKASQSNGRASASLGLGPLPGGSNEQQEQRPALVLDRQGQDAAVALLRQRLGFKVVAQAAHRRSLRRLFLPGGRSGKTSLSKSA